MVWCANARQLCTHSYARTFYSNLRVDLLFDRGKMVGGIVYEYYSRSCCGLIAYYCVHPSYKKFDYGTLLVRAAEREIHEIALRLGQP